MRKQHLTWLVLGLVVVTGFAALAAKGVVGLDRCRQQVVKRVLDAAASYTVQSPAFRARMQTLESRIERVAGEGSTATALVHELNSQLKEKATRAELAELDTAIARLDTKAGGLADTDSRYRDELNAVRSQVEAFKEHLKQSERLAGELDYVRDQLASVRQDASAMRTAITAVGNELHAYQRRMAAEQQRRDACYARLTEEENNKVIVMACRGFDRLKHGDAATGLDELQAAHVWDPSAAEYVYGIAIAKRMLGDSDAARRAVADAMEKEHVRPTAEWFGRVLIGIQGPHRQWLEAQKADPLLHHRLAFSPR